MLFAKKSLGQHFLMHAATAERIVAVSGVGKGDTVLEIGPGTGLLTRPLLARAAKVIAVETDGALVETLKETFAPEIAAGRLILLKEDVRTFDLGSIGGSYTLVANIPYYITGEIIRLFLTTSHKPSSMTLLVQKEVAERIARARKESLLSLSVKAYGSPKYQFTVPRGAFSPAPSVDSAVLSIEGIEKDSFASREEEARFFDVLHAGFAHKRKRLMKNLEDVAPIKDIEGAFAAIGLDRNARSEDVELREWRSLTKSLRTNAQNT